MNGEKTFSAEAALGVGRLHARRGDSGGDPDPRTGGAAATTSERRGDETIVTQEIRRTAAKTTVEKLMQALHAKLEAAVRWEDYQAQLEREGVDDCGGIFGRLAEYEREDVRTVVRCLEEHAGHRG